jgi:hypothetical protein
MGWLDMDDAFERAVEEERRERRERRHRRARAGFRAHATAFVAVNALLLVIWAATTLPDGGHPWFLYPLFGWGVGVIVHFSMVRPALLPSRKQGEPREDRR